MNKQAEHYENQGDVLRGEEAEKAYRAAQNHLQPSEKNYFSDIIRIQNKIISSLEQQRLGKVLTAPEAAALWGLDDSTVKKACQAGRFLAHEARKTGRVWLVTRAGMERVYGPKKLRG